MICLHCGYHQCRCHDDGCLGQVLGGCFLVFFVPNMLAVLVALIWVFLLALTGGR